MPVLRLLCDSEKQEESTGTCCKNIITIKRLYMQVENRKSQYGDGSFTDKIFAEQGHIFEKKTIFAYIFKGVSLYCEKNSSIRTVPILR